MCIIEEMKKVAEEVEYKGYWYKLSHIVEMLIYRYKALKTPAFRTTALTLLSVISHLITLRSMIGHP